MILLQASTVSMPIWLVSFLQRNNKSALNNEQEACYSSSISRLEKFKKGSSVTLILKMH